MQFHADIEQHPELSPHEQWVSLFKSKDKAVIEDLESLNGMFRPSQQPAHEEILRLLHENDKDTITLVAIGPLTNLAMAAATDPETFLRAKEVVVMGGTIDEPGNVSNYSQRPC